MNKKQEIVQRSIVNSNNYQKRNKRNKSNLQFKLMDHNKINNKNSSYHVKIKRIN